MRRIASLLCVFVLCATTSESQIRTYVREYTYRAGEADSKLTAQKIALNQVRRLLLEEVGVYLESTLSVDRREDAGQLTDLTRQQITSITAGVTETKILQERWTGEEYYIKASIAVDPEEVREKVRQVAGNAEKLRELERASSRADSAMREIARLREELASTRDENERLRLRTEYAKTSDVIGAGDWFQKGYAALAAGNAAQAVAHLQKAIALDPASPELQHNLGAAYVAKGELRSALPCFERAVSMNPVFVPSLMAAGYVHVQLREFTEALPWYDRVLAVDPGQAEAHYWIGYSYNEMGQYSAAAQALEQAVALRPDYAEAYYSLGWGLQRSGDHVGAMQQFERALAVRPDYADAMLAKGGSAMA